ncbi:hypothetical protein EWB00_000831, partial [Schistosoma japonicum]
MQDGLKSVCIGVRWRRKKLGTIKSDVAICEILAVHADFCESSAETYYFSEAVDVTEISVRENLTWNQVSATAMLLTLLQGVTVCSTVKGPGLKLGSTLEMRICRKGDFSAGDSVQQE